MYKVGLVAAWLIEIWL